MLAIALTVVLSTPSRAPKAGGGSSEFLEGRRHGLDAEVELVAPQDGTKAGRDVGERVNDTSTSNKASAAQPQQ